MEKFVKFKLLSILLCCSFLCGCALAAGSGAMVGLDLAKSLGNLFGTEGMQFYADGKEFDKVKQATEKVIVDLGLTIKKTEQAGEDDFWYYCWAEKDDINIAIHLVEEFKNKTRVWVTADNQTYMDGVLAKIATELRIPLKQHGALVNPEVADLIYQDHLEKYSQEQKQEQGNQEFLKGWKRDKLLTTLF